MELYSVFFEAVATGFGAIVSIEGWVTSEWSRRGVLGFVSTRAARPLRS